MIKKYFIYKKHLSGGVVEIVQIDIAGNGFSSEYLAEAALFHFLGADTLMQSETFVIIPEYSYDEIIYRAQADLEETLRQ